MRKLLKNKRGVTLIELLAVLVILGIIAAIAVPTIGNLIDNQREKAAKLEFSNIQDAAELYASTEEPAANFSLADIETAGYIEFDGTFTDAVGGVDLSTVAIFDVNGDLDAAAITAAGSGDIFIDDYQVYPAV